MLRSSLLLAATTLAASPALAADNVPDYIQASIASAGRPPGDIAQDAARKPAAALAFSLVKPGDKVVDFLPGGGYYTRLLSKIVGPSGHVYAYVPVLGGRDAEHIRADEEAGKIKGPLPVDDALAIENIAEYSNDTVIWETINFGQFGLPEQVDEVWTSDNYHDLHNKAYGAPDMAALNKGIFKAMKPGGIYYVIDHRTAKGAGFTQTETLHRSDPDAVKAEIMAAGFTFDGASEALANSADDHSKIVFDPSIRSHTDQYILRFRKPTTATGDERPTDDAIKTYYGNSFFLGTPEQRTRTMFYHPDHSYQEFGQHDMQSGQWFWNADGRNCMLHQFPAEQRGFTTCHPFAARPAPDKWTETLVGGMQMTVGLLKGYVYPTP